MEILTTQEFILTHSSDTNRSGEVVSGDIRYIDDGRPKPVMIISHGFKTFKDWGMFPHIGEFFAERGFVTIVVNFARNGVESGQKQITNWDRFATLTPSSEIDDLYLVIGAVGEGALEYYGIDVENTERILLGHSGGAAVSIITASEREDINAVISWSSPSTFDRVNPEEKKVWRESGEIKLHGDSEYGTIRLGREPLDDIENNRERLNILEAAKRLQCPLFIAQGDEDQTVLRKEAELIAGAAENTKNKYFELQGVNHMYGVEHPYVPGSSQDLIRLLDETYKWIQSVLTQ